MNILGSLSGHSKKKKEQIASFVNSPELSAEELYTDDMNAILSPKKVRNFRTGSLSGKKKHGLSSPSRSPVLSLWAKPSSKGKMFDTSPDSTLRSPEQEKKEKKNILRSPSGKKKQNIPDTLFQKQDYNNNNNNNNNNTESNTESRLTESDLPSPHLIDTLSNTSLHGSFNNNRFSISALPNPILTGEFDIPSPNEINLKTSKPDVSSIPTSDLSDLSSIDINSLPSPELHSFFSPDPSILPSPETQSLAHFDNISLDNLPSLPNDSESERSSEILFSYLHHSRSSGSSLDSINQNSHELLQYEKQKEQRKRSGSLRQTLKEATDDSNSKNTKRKKGVELPIVPDNNQIYDPNLPLPRMLTRLVSWFESDLIHLKTPAIFISSPTSKIPSDLKNFFEKNGEWNLSDCPPCSACYVSELIKNFFLEAKYPLIPASTFQNPERLPEILSLNFKSVVYRYFMNLLPMSNRKILIFMLNFLDKLLQYSEDNLISLDTITETFGPIFLNRNTKPSHGASRLLSDFIFFEIQKLITKESVYQELGEGSITIPSLVTPVEIFQWALVSSEDDEFANVLTFCWSYFIKKEDLLEITTQVKIQHNEYSFLIERFWKNWIRHNFKTIMRDEKFVNSFLEKYPALKITLALPPVSGHQSPVVIHKSRSVSKSKDSLRKNENLNISDNFDIDHYSVLKESPRHWAKALCISDLHYLRKIEFDFKEKNFLSDEYCPTLHNATQFFNSVANWVGAQVLLQFPEQGQESQRADTLIHFIQIANECVSNNNFNTAYAIISALNFSSLQRLRLSWDKISKKEKDNFEKLNVLFAAQKNYSNYKHELKQRKPPAVPLLTLFPRAAISLDELDTLKTHPFSNRRLVNFNKFLQMAKLVTGILKYQEVPYQFKKFRNSKAGTLLVKICKKFGEKVLSFETNNQFQESLYQASLKAEPKI